LDYLEETVQCYVRAVLEKDPGERIESQELAWARDVLTRYFGQGDDHPTVARLRAEFEATTYVPVTVAAERSNDRSPYLRASDFVSPISIDALHELARHRRSVRWFEQRSVPRELIDRAARVALESPSACNRQPFKFLIFDQEPLLRKVADLPAGTRGFSHNFPCVVVVLGKLDSYFDERDRHLIYIDASLATMSFLFALESQGVASCCINWADIPEREERARRLLHLAPDERPIMFIALGFPDPSGLVPYSEKKSLKNLVQYNLEHQINGAE